MVKCDVYICPKVVLNLKKTVNSPFKNKIHLEKSISVHRIVWDQFCVGPECVFLLGLKR